MTGPMACCPVIDTSSSAETPAWAATVTAVAAVAAEWCPDAPTVAALAAGALPRAKAAARPAIAAGAAAMGSRRRTEVLAELAELAWAPKGLLPAKVALTRKAACTVHLVLHECRQPSERLTSRDRKRIIVDSPKIGQKSFHYVEFAAQRSRDWQGPTPVALLSTHYSRCAQPFGAGRAAAA